MGDPNCNPPPLLTNGALRLVNGVEHISLTYISQNATYLYTFKLYLWELSQGVKDLAIYAWPSQRPSYTWCKSNRYRKGLKAHIKHYFIHTSARQIAQ
jgi:hypothetical protein